MTSPTPFASVPTPRDAVDPARLLPRSGPATSGLTVSPPGRVALSSPPPGYVDESKTCVYCGETFYRYTKIAPAVWGRRTYCNSRKCRSHGQSARRALRQPNDRPKDGGREAILFAGLSFTDDARAAKPEARFTKLPEPSQSLTGSHGQMCASARRT